MPISNLRVTAEGVISGYIAVWGSPRDRDSYNTWFDKRRPPDLGINGFLPLRLMYKHGRDPEIGRAIIGKVVRVWTDQTGIAFQARLDRTKPFFDRIVDEIIKNRLATSSGSAEHLAEWDRDGRFVDWYLSELSLEDNPSEWRMPKVSLLRTNTCIRCVIPKNSPGELVVTRRVVSSTIIRETGNMLEDLLAPGTEVSPEELLNAMVEKWGAEVVQQLLQQLAPAADTMMPEGQPQQAAPPNRSVIDLKALLEQGNRLQQALRRQQQTTPVVVQPPVRENPTRENSTSITDVKDMRYSHLSYRGMALIHQVLSSRGNRVSDTFMRALALKSAQHLDKKGFIDPQDTAVVRSAFPLQYFRADEIMQSDLASGGDEWVGVMYSTTLWETIRQARIYQELLDRGMMEVEVPQGHESIWIPTEGTDPIWYAGTEAANKDATGRPEVTVSPTKAGTGRQSLAPGEAKAAVFWSDLLEEDSLIPVGEQLMKQLDESGENAIEYIIFNGDTATGANTNLNLIDGTPSISGLDKPLYLVTDGILKLPIITTTTLSRDAGATFDEDDFLQTYKLLPNALRQVKDNLLFVIDGDTEVAAMAIPSIKTRDVFSAATLEEGMLIRMWGIDIFNSGQIALANTAGKISATGANNTKGRIACVVCPYWALGWKRKVYTEAGRDPLSGTNFIVSRMRVGVKFRSNNAAAVSYNVNVL